MLFRNEAVEAQRVKLYGNVVLVSPISFKIITLFLCAICIGALFFVFLGNFTRTETVRGQVVPSAGLIKVYPAAKGVISRLELSEGTRVVAGDVVGNIQTQGSNISADSLGAIKLSALKQNISLINSRISSVNQESKNLEDELKVSLQELHRKLKLENERLNIQESLLLFLNKSHERSLNLYKKEIGSVNELERKKIEILGQEKEKNQIVKSIADLKTQILDIKNQLKNLPIQLSLKLSTLNEQLVHLNKEIKELSTASSFNIGIPITGHATTLLASTGHEVNPEKSIFSVLPENSELEVELFIPSRAMGNIEIGKEVKLLFDAFPYQKFGTIDGEIRTATASAIQPNELNVPVAFAEPLFRVKVRLDRNYFLAYGRKHFIQTGMMATGIIILERRTFIQWLLDPILSVSLRAK